MKANYYTVILKGLLLKAFLRNHKSGCVYKNIFHDEGISREGRSIRARMRRKTFLGFTTGKRLLKGLYLKGAEEEFECFLK